jgi:hypothetical protein
MPVAFTYSNHHHSHVQSIHAPAMMYEEEIGDLEGMSSETVNQRETYGDLNNRFICRPGETLKPVDGIQPGEAFQSGHRERRHQHQRR